jgi:hypothetical protein
VFGIGKQNSIPVTEQIHRPISLVAQALAYLPQERRKEVFMVDLGLVALSNDLIVGREEPNRLRISGC